jgi:hypothetical protein
VQKDILEQKMSKEREINRLVYEIRKAGNMQRYVGVDVDQYYRKIMNISSADLENILRGQLD